MTKKPTRTTVTASGDELELPDDTIERPIDDDDELEEDGELEASESHEDAPYTGEEDTVPAAPSEPEADAESDEEAVERVIPDLDEAEIPPISTEHELAAYTSGYRLGSDGPDYVQGLAEMGRHLGSNFEPAEEEAFLALPAEDFWPRWWLGYIDALHGRAQRSYTPRDPSDFDW